MASLLAALREKLVSGFGLTKLTAVSQALLFVLAGFLVFGISAEDRDAAMAFRDPSWSIIRLTRNDIVRLNAPLPKGARILFLHDRFPADAWGPQMMCQLLYRDRDLKVDRPTMMTARPKEEDYDKVFDYVDGRLTVVRSRDTKSRLTYPE